MMVGQIKRHKILHNFLSVLLTAFLIGVSWFSFDLKAIFSSISGAMFWPLMMTVPTMWMVILLRGVRLRAVLQQGSISQITSIAIQHNTWNALLPFRLGEMALIVLLNNRLGLKPGTGLKFLAIIRLGDIVMLGVFGLLMFLAFYQLGAASAIFPNYENSPAYLMFAGLIGLSIIAFLNWIGRKFAAKGELLQALVKFWKVVALSAAIWCLLWAVCFLALYSVSPDLGPTIALIGFTGSALTFLLPVSGIANIGSFHAGWVGAVMTAGLSVNDALSSAVLAHAAMLGGTISLYAIDRIHCFFQRKEEDDPRAV